MPFVAASVLGRSSRDTEANIAHWGGPLCQARPIVLTSVNNKIGVKEEDEAEEELISFTTFKVGTGGRRNASCDSKSTTKLSPPKERLFVQWPCLFLRVPSLGCLQAKPKKNIRIFERSCLSLSLSLALSVLV